MIGGYIDHCHNRLNQVEFPDHTLLRASEMYVDDRSVLINGEFRIETSREFVRTVIGRSLWSSSGQAGKRCVPAVWKVCPKPRAIDNTKAAEDDNCGDKAKSSYILAAN